MLRKTKADIGKSPHQLFVLVCVSEIVAAVYQIIICYFTAHEHFFAGCIANALLDQDVPVLMTNFPTILNRLTGMFPEDRSEFIASFDEYG